MKIKVFLIDESVYLCKEEQTGEEVVDGNHNYLRITTPLVLSR